jgi:glutaconate CoA-transferase subunit B
MSDYEPTKWEIMASIISHELKDGDVMFLGMSTGEITTILHTYVPGVGLALARRSHAPNCYITSTDSLLMERILGDNMKVISAANIYLGEIDIGLSSCAQVDKHGNQNIVTIGDYDKPSVRLVGPILQPTHLSYMKREIIAVDHEARNFVDKVDFISGVGHQDLGDLSREAIGLPGTGPCMIMTDLCIFDFPAETKLATLKWTYPGVSVDDVRENTNFVHDYIPDRVNTAPLPTQEEIRLIREEFDPDAQLLPR